MVQSHLKPPKNPFNDKKKQVMVCGVDCHQGDSNCNGYCTGKADSPQAATEEIVLSSLLNDANAKLNLAEKAWYEYFCALPVGRDREKASDVYENVRCARRVG